MGYFEKIYQSDLNHRARAVYMYRQRGQVLAGDTHDLRRAAAVPLYRQAGLGRSVQGGANLQGAALSGEREPQLKFIPAEVVRKI